MDIYIYNNSRSDFIKLPVVPLSISVGSPQKIETFEAIGVGDLKIIGIKGNRSLNLSSFFPVKDYVFLRDRSLKGMEYIDKIEVWRSDRKPVSVVISELNINMQCTIENLTYGIQDGSGDIYYNMPLEEFKAPVVKKVTPATKLKTTTETVTFIKNTYGVIVGSVLNVRSGAGLGYSEVGELKKGDKVKILEFKGDWWKITYKNKVAYVYGKNQQIKKV